MPPETPAPIPPPEAPPIAPAQPAEPSSGALSQEAQNQHTIVGGVSLALLGFASFFFVFSYLDGLVPREGQAAAASVSEKHRTFADVSLEASAAIVMDINTGAVLYEKNADAQMALASLTKVPLALAVSEVLSPEKAITVPYDTGFTEGAQRLLKGEVWTVRDILHFTLIASSNEGAQMLADAADADLRKIYPEAPAGGASLWRMNNLAQTLGLSSMYFLNVNGLDASETQAGSYGSARDVAKLFAYAAEARPDVFAGTAKEDLLLVDEKGETTAAFNTNEALSGIPNLVMGKTGFTDLAGGNLAIVFDAGLSQPVAIVVLHSSHDGRFSDMRALVAGAQAAIAQ